MRTKLHIEILTAFFATGLALAQSPDSPPGTPANARALMVLAAPDQVTAEALAGWKREGFTSVAVVLDDQTPKDAYRQLAGLMAQAGLPLYYWIEIARQPEMAAAHPRWMASLGSHEDWRRRFPNTPMPRDGEVAKAFPWVPIHYQEAFDAHLRRIDDLLARVPAAFRGVLLNDLQGGPSSCGCGNLQCRWATDYHVPATGTRIKGDDVAAKFLTRVRSRLPGRDVIPVWTTECEHEDLPPDKRDGAPSTGLCGTVGCSVGLCPKEYTRQWKALLGAHDGPVGLLGLHRELERDRPGVEEGPAWLRRAVAYADEVPAKHGGESVPHARLWLVVQGKDPAQETAVRRIAESLKVGGVIVARTRVEQSFEPRVISVK